MKFLNKPIKQYRFCGVCNRKKIFVFRWQSEAGGLWTQEGEPCLPFMKCPRCGSNAMIQKKEIEWLTKDNTDRK